MPLRLLARHQPEALTEWRCRQFGEIGAKVPHHYGL